MQQTHLFNKTLATTKSYSMSKQARTVLSLAFGLAVRYDVIARNPVRDTVRLHKPPSQAKALTIEEINVIRDAARSWRRGTGLVAPPPMASWSRSLRSCSAHQPASGRCWRSASAMSM